MQYATQESLIKRYGTDSILSIALTPERTLDSDKIQEALEDASQTIDSYLAGRYTLPLLLHCTLFPRKKSCNRTSP